MILGTNGPHLFLIFSLNFNCGLVMFLAVSSLKEAVDGPYAQGLRSNDACIMDSCSNKLTIEWQFQLPLMLIFCGVISKTTVSACFVEPTALS